ncbi:iron complex transport system ATP-binding protein [Dietzia kunjamensis subsp. schimae]|jgi:iron complex transport system ATP-binding protein|uniref:Iron complex transport system ATP-binding protein n=1 Tax=Dietzia kunjamensis subsp. schimae TaxID=498198 RepID=A0ABY1N4P0_9ACTN|nr:MULTISPECIES: ABC transporter ATP-binding protein [Dietzia]MCZ4541147.1 ABC transporter ATP-binding protein [Dietzia maris]MCZ4656870.1 ABC transporter ATP-binding protein [Dietzia kunjamensis]MDJ0423391.1 ABC transporter ATP-binding protein [Dietzia kunjamensis]MDV3355911.1 ABC transporter ATP-binding protein [Dietzia sp. IN118]USX46954.1 ABC transporter ATP-binding protein [Dietzia kunjamensis]
MTAAPSTLEARCVSWSVRGRTILDDVTVAPAPGTMVGVLGPNGSGKSTLLRILTGLLRPDTGSVHLDGTDIRSIPRKRLSRRVALVAQEATTDQNPTVREVIELGRIPHRAAWSGPGPGDDGVVRRAAATTGLGDRLDQRYATLSGGERQRVQIARALAQEPGVLVLDEPTNHLDIRHQLDLLALVRATDTTVIAALHDLTLAATFCDHLIVLSGGRLVTGGAPHEVLTADLIREVYGVEAEVTHDGRGAHVRYLAR